MSTQPITAAEMSDQCPNCGTDMVYDPCPGYPRGDGPPPPMMRASVICCDLCGQICCSDYECLQRCESDDCKVLMCKSCAQKGIGGDYMLCPPHLKSWRAEEAERLDSELEDLSCRVEDVFGKGSPEVAAVEQARDVLRQSAGKVAE